MPFVQEDGSEYGAAEEATEVRRTQNPVVKGISVRRGDGPKTPDGVGLGWQRHLHVQGYNVRAG